EGVGFEAAAMLDQLMQGHTLRKPVHKVAPKGVSFRKSSDAIAVKDLRVAKTLSYIWENSHRPITVPELAAHVGVPLRTLQWAFQRSMDCSLQDEISKRRLKIVKTMLCNTDRSVGKIAQDLQFSSAQYLNHFFVKAMGMTPSEYRQQKRGEGDVDTDDASAELSASIE
ncbi:MAG: helix-turn-helix domain-containing protein, partial [Kiritimatiellales bacterium]|nr:helix-turn-helix domain-containing protein [Kiritimatiellales bacterium]